MATREKRTKRSSSRRWLLERNAEGTSNSLPHSISDQLCFSHGRPLRSVPNTSSTPRPARRKEILATFIDEFHRKFAERQLFMHYARRPDSQLTIERKAPAPAAGDVANLPPPPPVQAQAPHKGAGAKAALLPPSAFDFGDVKEPPQGGGGTLPIFSDRTGLFIYVHF